MWLAPLVASGLINFAVWEDWIGKSVFPVVIRLFRSEYTHTLAYKRMFAGVVEFT